MMAMLKKYPKASAVIMQRHGIFVWGQNTWERTKQM
jgi:rhamnose utilization protein RhaD (predicted bifunctional aldolase and dehydrogenase)